MIAFIKKIIGAFKSPDFELEGYVPTKELNGKWRHDWRTCKNSWVYRDARKNKK